LVPIPLHIFSTHYFTEVYHKKAELLSFLTDGASKTLYDSLANVRAVKTFGRDWEEAGRYAGRWSGSFSCSSSFLYCRILTCCLTLYAAYHQLEYELDKINFNRISVQQVLESAMRFLLLGFCYYAIMGKNMTVGTMSMLLNYQYMILSQLSSLNSLFSRSIRTLRRVTPLIEMLLQQDDLKDSPDAVDLPVLKNKIELKNIEFSYGKFPALRDVSITIEKVRVLPAVVSIILCAPTDSNLFSF
jgi:ABC-type multidrug transport system fused ATPase/permease subunit